MLNPDLIVGDKYRIGDQAAAFTYVGKEKDENDPGMYLYEFSHNGRVGFWHTERYLVNHLSRY